jgi:hypothetical protein
MTTLDSRARSAAARGWSVALGTGAIVSLAALAWAMARAPQHRSWDGDVTDLPALLRWLASGISEPQFYTSAAASVGLLGGGLLAHLARRSASPWAGFVQACGTGIWPAVAGSALASMVMGNLVWGWTLGAAAWQPLFVPLVSVAPAMVVLYGPDRRTVTTAAVLGGLLTPPLAVLAVEQVCGPLDLPAVVGVTGGMGVGGLVAFTIARHLPWLPGAGAWRSTTEAPAAPRMRVGSGPWVLRRALADFSEAQFFGNEWASAAMVLGALVAYAADETGLFYGSGLFVALLASQVLTALTGVVVWRRKWQELGFYPTFVPVVSVAPAAVLTFGGSLPAVVVGALLGALIGPPVAASISSRLPADFHPFIGNVLSMSVSTAAIVPVLHLVPGIAT